MLQTESGVIIIDNSGAKTGQVIAVLKGSTGRKAGLGDRVKVAIKTAAPSSAFKKGEVATAVIVRLKKEIGRKDGTYIRFSDNAVALINKDNEPVAKRIFGPVARELREKGFKEVAALADEVL